ncbi:MAG: argininosuccinate lyase [Acidobacteriota bacterium]|nr:argininosuccinate lyase [Acidobacteriota bacterium]
MWSGRFRQPLDPEFERWQRSFPFDQRLIQEEIAASRAHAKALNAAGILSPEEFADMLRGLSAVAATAPELFDDPEAEDVHHFVEKRLQQEIGETALKLHAGRSRNEQIATDLRLFVRAACNTLQTQLAELAQAAAAQAKKAGMAAMPSYTHLQRAEPVLVAHWLLAYCEMFLRDATRLADCRARLNYCPLGSGAIAGATLKLDREMVAAELKFTAPTANSMDATSDRDFAIEFAQTLSIVAVHLSRWAEEFILFSTLEYGFVHLPESYSTGSSAMPQKQNPDALELIRGKAGRVIGAAQQLLVTLKGLPLAYNKDMQETQEPVFAVADTVSMMLKVAAGFMREVTLDLDHMTKAAGTGYMNAMAAATYLSEKGVPFRRAHEIIGRAVRLGLEQGRELHEMLIDDLKGISEAFDADFYESVTLQAVLDCHNVTGGTARERVAQALAEMEARLQKLLPVEDSDVHA